jgi:predicted metal-dependent hydrolase
MTPIVVIGSPIWLDELKLRLPEGYTLLAYHSPSGYIPRLADDHAALILVDATREDWRFWTTTPKTSPATRRIPLFLIGDVATETGLTVGADLVFPVDQFLHQLPQLIGDYARLQSAEEQAQLQCDCEAELPQLAQQGIEKFNQREFYKQHDLFEALWVETQSPVRDLYRAILQVGVAYFQIERGNYRGAHKMLLRSVQWLTLLPDQCQGVDVAQLKEDSYRVRLELERLGESKIHEFNQSLLKPVKITDKN